MFLVSYELKKSEETKNFVKIQNNIFDDYRDSIQQTRDDVLDYTTKIYDYPKYGLPSRHGDYYYYSHNPGKLKMECLEIFRIFCRSHVFITDEFFRSSQSKHYLPPENT